MIQRIVSIHSFVTKRMVGYDIWKLLCSSRAAIAQWLLVTTKWHYLKGFHAFMSTMMIGYIRIVIHSITPESQDRWNVNINRTRNCDLVTESFMLSLYKPAINYSINCWQPSLVVHFLTFNISHFSFLFVVHQFLFLTSLFSFLKLNWNFLRAK